ncbi:hypothetical protein WN51_13093, partial [Melipona quadrifasciata]
EEEQEKRKSKDKVVNDKGQKLLKMAAESGWHILNGNMQGDEKGEFTYIEKRGETVIDYILTNTKGLDKIEKFQVGSRIDSDHQLLNVTVKTRGENRRGGE